MGRRVRWWDRRARSTLQFYAGQWVLKQTLVDGLDAVQKRMVSRIIALPRREGEEISRWRARQAHAGQRFIGERWGDMTAKGAINGNATSSSTVTSPPPRRFAARVPSGSMIARRDSV